MRYLRLSYFGHKPASHGGVGPLMDYGMSRMVAVTEARYFIKRYGNDVLIEDMRTGTPVVTHRGANVPAAKVKKEVAEVDAQDADTTVDLPLAPGAEVHASPLIRDLDSDVADDMEEAKEEAPVFDFGDDDEPTFDLQAMLAEVTPSLSEEGVAAVMALYFGGAPMTEEALVEIKGIGPAKAKKILEQLP